MAAPHISNAPPFCAELFSPRSLPYGFHAARLQQFGDGFPVLFDINLDAAAALDWLAFIQAGGRAAGVFRMVGCTTAGWLRLALRACLLPHLAASRSCLGPPPAAGGVVPGQPYSAPAGPGGGVQPGAAPLLFGHCGVRVWQGRLGAGGELCANVTFWRWLFLLRTCKV